MDGELRMKIIWQDYVWRFLGCALIIFFGGWLLGSALNFAGMASPQVVSKLFCPEGSTATWVLSPGQGDQNSQTISCQDQNGHIVLTLPVEQTIALQRKYFYRPSFIIMAVLATAWFIWSSIREFRNQANL